MSKCENCGIDFEGKRASAKYCSAKCRVEASRKVKENEHIEMVSPITPELFEFKTPDVRQKSGFHEKENGEVIIRKALYWYDVPLAAIPIVKKGCPEVPEYMDGRQYFLWWKNNFEEKDGKKIILNPHPVYEKIDYVKAGQESRRWGA